MPDPASPRPNQPLSESERAQRAFVRSRLVVLVVAWMVPLIGWLYAPFVSNGPIVCGSRLLFKISCPGCGLTRGVTAACRLDWQASLRFHPLALPIVAGCLTVGFTALVELSTGKRRSWYRRFLHERWLVRLFGLMLVVYAIRWITGTLPPV